MALPVSVFAVLCLSNCALISVWEDEVDLSHGQTSLTLQFGSGATISRLLPWLAAALCTAAWLLAPRSGRPSAACGAASGLFLGLVDLAERRIGRSAARVLADLAVMTPVVPVALWALA
jgi:hypothetical protein